jgi:hypothetical protein
MIETGPDDAVRIRLYSEDTAPRIKRLILFTEHQCYLWATLENGGHAVGLIPVVGRKIDELGHLGPVFQVHHAELDFRHCDP